jgi:hypothetical protein
MAASRLRVFPEDRRRAPLQNAAVTHETHRCSIDGCPSLADYRVMLYAFDPVGGAIRFEPDLSCPYVCREHAADNEQQARGERGTDVRVVYPYTNQGGERGLSIYLDLPSSDAA